VEPWAPARAVRTVLRDLLATPDLRGAALMEEIRAVGESLAVDPFRACLEFLAAGRAGEPEARQIVERIESHRADLESRLERDPGFAVAAADFLHATRPGTWGGGPDAGARAPAPNDTGRCLDDVLECELRRHQRTGRPLGLVLLSPLVPSDEPGWSGTMAALSEAARDIDRIARVLPDGVAVLLPCTAGDDAVRAAARLRAVAGRVTGTAWSAGVAAVPEGPEGAEALAAAARRALAEAVREGAAVRRAAPERRRHGRRPPSGDLRARIGAGERAAEAVVEDLSLGGILVRTPRPLVPGLRVALEIGAAPPRARRLSVDARVVRSEAPAPGTTGSWRAALSFEVGNQALPVLADLLASGREPGERR
jgi:PilZ domain-containing protein